jgi:hypothetical protein
MNAELTVEQARLAREVLASGRAKTSEEAAELVLREAEESLDRGEGIVINSPEELHEFFEGIKRRGRARLAARARTSAGQVDLRG